jgi:hypothetical protein
MRRMRTAREVSCKELSNKFLLHQNFKGDDTVTT